MILLSYSVADETYKMILVLKIMSLPIKSNKSI